MYANFISRSTHKLVMKNYEEENARDMHHALTGFKIVSVIYALFFIGFVALILSIALS